MFTFLGITYYTCEGEADLLCCKLVMSGQAWACLSDDMDLFVYGCTRVLRYISLLKGTVLCYDTVEHLNICVCLQMISNKSYLYQAQTIIWKIISIFINALNIMRLIKRYDSKSFYNWLDEKNVIKNGDELMKFATCLTQIFIYIITKL